MDFITCGHLVPLLAGMAVGYWVIPAIIEEFFRKKP